MPAKAQQINAARFACSDPVNQRPEDSQSHRHYWIAAGGHEG